MKETSKGKIKYTVQIRTKYAVKNTAKPEIEMKVKTLKSHRPNEDDL